MYLFLFYFSNAVSDKFINEFYLSMTDLQTRQPLLNDEKAMLLLALNNYIFLVFSSVSTFVNHKNSADDLCCYNFQ